MQAIFGKEVDGPTVAVMLSLMPLHYKKIYNFDEPHVARIRLIDITEWRHFHWTPL